MLGLRFGQLKCSNSDFGSFLSLRNRSHRRSGVNQSLFFSKRQGNKGEREKLYKLAHSLVNSSLTTSSTISPFFKNIFDTQTSWSVTYFSLGEEQTPTIVAWQMIKKFPNVCPFCGRDLKFRLKKSSRHPSSGLGGDLDRLKNASINYPLMKTYFGTMDMSVLQLVFFNLKGKPVIATLYSI